MLLFPDSILRILFGEEYVSGATALSILSLGFFLSVSVGPVASIILTLGRTKLNLLVSIISALLTVILSIVLVPIYGINGAAVATGISQVSFTAILFLFVYKFLKTQPFNLHYIKAVCAVLISSSLIYFIFKTTFTLIPLPFLLMSFVLFLFLYIFLLLIFKSLDEEDLMIIKALEKKTGIRLGWIRRVMRKLIR